MGAELFEAGVGGEGAFAAAEGEVGEAGEVVRGDGVGAEFEGRVGGVGRLLVAAQAVVSLGECFERDIENRHPDKGEELILYCGGGYRSALAADNLQRMGYTNVYSLAGGWRAWKESGAPFEGE